MNIKPIHNEADYQAALKAVSVYFENETELNTPESDHFDVLFTLIESYESVHYKIDPPDPIEAIKFRMSNLG